MSAAAPPRRALAAELERQARPPLRRPRAAARGADPQQRGRSRRGARGRSNERLEFLGDRVLGLVIADLLMARFPQRERGRAHQAPRRAGLPRDAGRGRARARSRPLPWCWGGARRTAGGPRQSRDPRRRARGADRRALSRRRARRRPQAFIRRHWRARLRRDAQRRRAMPRPRCRNGRRARGLGAADLPAWSRPRAPPHAPRFEVSVRARRACRRRAPAPAPSAPPSRPRRSSCWPRSSPTDG